MSSSGNLNIAHEDRSIGFGMRAEKVDPALSGLMRGYGERLRAARLALGYGKQSEFARMLGVEPDRYNHWEKERHPPRAEYLALLRQRFGIGADWILSGDYGALSARLLQAMTVLGASQDAPEAAKELRVTLPDAPDPARRSGGGTLHEDPPSTPGRLVRHPEI